VLTIPTLRLTDRDPSTVVIEVYRSQANAVADQSQGQITPPMNLVGTVANDITQDTVTFTDVSTDASIAGNLELYTAGGLIIDYSPCPPGTQVCTWNNCVYVGDLDGQQNTLAFSNPHAFGQPIQFNDTGRLTINSGGGTQITALAVYNNELIAFKDRSVWMITGQAPNAEGLNGNLSAQLVATDVGCIDPNSLVLAGSQGLMFQSYKGIYLLNPGGPAVQYVGANVEPLIQGVPITSAVLASDVNQVRFTLQQGSQGLVPTFDGNLGQMVVYDYFVQQWMTYTGLDAADSCVYNGTHTLIKDNGQVWQEQAGLFDDPYGWFGSLFEFNEIRPYGLQHMLLKTFTLEGNYLGAHQLRVSMAINGCDWDSFSRQFNATTVQNQPSGTYGSWTYGTSSTGSIGQAYGGPDYSRYLWQLNLNTECYSVRFKVEELQPPAGPSSAGVQFNNVTMEVSDLNRPPVVPSLNMA